jgi:DNA-binding beta-propeller fold protein YncE
VTRALRPLAAGVAALAALALGAAACADADDPGRNAPPGGAVAAPYPPRAAEPARSPAPGAPPAGRVVRVGGGPEGVVVDGRTGLAAVGLRDPAALALVDVRTGRVRRRVALPAAPRHLQLAPPSTVLVPAEDADVLVQVRLPGGAARAVEAGAHPHDATSLRGRVYVADEFGSTVSVLRGGRLERQVPVDVQPGGVAAVGGLVAAISVRAYTVELLDPRTLRGLGSQSAGEGPTHVVVDDDGRLYIADTRGDALIVFATRPRLRWIARVPLPGSPYGLASDAPRGRVWVTLTARNELVEVATGDRPRRVRALPTVRQPNTVGVDPRTGRVVVASRTDGTLQLVDP